MCAARGWHYSETARRISSTSPAPCRRTHGPRSIRPSATRLTGEVGQHGEAGRRLGLEDGDGPRCDTSSSSNRPHRCQPFSTQRAAASVLTAIQAGCAQAGGCRGAGWVPRLQYALLSRKAEKRRSERSVAGGLHWYPAVGHVLVLNKHSMCAAGSRRTMCSSTRARRRWWRTSLEPSAGSSIWPRDPADPLRPGAKCHGKRDLAASPSYRDRLGAASTPTAD